MHATGSPLQMAFHSFDRQLVIADEHDMIRWLKSHFILKDCLTHPMFAVFGIGRGANAFITFETGT